MKKSSLLSVFTSAALCCLLFASCTGGGASSSPSTDASLTASPTTRPPATAADPTTDPAADPTTGDDGTTPTNPTDAPSEPPAQPTTPAPPQPPAGTHGEAVAALAKTLVDTPYRYGAAGPDAFDNSGLVYYCMKQNGISTPRKTGDIARAGAEVAKESLQPGDVVFFWNDTPGVPQFAGIYIGGQQFVASNHEEKPTSIHNMSYAYFTQRYVTARRLS